MSEIKFTAEFEGKIYDLGTVEVPDSVLRDTLVASGFARGVERDTRKQWSEIPLCNGSHAVPIG